MCAGLGLRSVTETHADFGAPTHPMWGLVSLEPWVSIPNLVSQLWRSFPKAGDKNRNRSLGLRLRFSTDTCKHGLGTRLMQTWSRYQTNADLVLVPD